MPSQVSNHRIGYLNLSPTVVNPRFQILHGNSNTAGQKAPVQTVEKRNKNITETETNALDKLVLLLCLNMQHKMYLRSAEFKRKPLTKCIRLTMVRKSHTEKKKL